MRPCIAVHVFTHCSLHCLSFLVEYFLLSGTTLHVFIRDDLLLLLFDVKHSTKLKPDQYSIFLILTSCLSVKTQSLAGNIFFKIIHETSRCNLDKQRIRSTDWSNSFAKKHTIMYWEEFNHLNLGNNHVRKESQLCRDWSRCYKLDDRCCRVASCRAHRTRRWGGWDIAWRG